MEVWNSHRSVFPWYLDMAMLFVFVCAKHLMLVDRTERIDSSTSHTERFLSTGSTRFDLKQGMLHSGLHFCGFWPLLLLPVSALTRADATLKDQNKLRR